MKRARKILMMLTCALCLVTLSLPKGFAQDLHFSQFMNSPLLTNPANTGFIPQADYRLGVNYRNQWSSIMSMPYKTMSAFGDVQVFRDRIETGWMGLGGVILHDVAGSGNLTSTKIYASVAYHQMIGVASLVSSGFNIGWANKRINTTNLTFPNQFDGKFFDAHLPGAAVLDKTSASYFDMQAGLNYAYFPTEDIYLNVGFSAMHVNRPQESFFSSKSGVDTKVPVRYTTFINASYKLNDQWIINPNVYASFMAKASEIVGGVNAHYNLSGDGEKQLIGGVYYRYKDAIIPMIGIGLKEYSFAFTYDVTMSTLKNYNSGRGAFEFSLVKEGFFSGNTDRQSLCPRF
ncbi:MAG: hypothetical protein C4308_13625 [Chitinophagaceae bacterium]